MSLQVHPETFALSHQLQDPSVVQRWNGVLVDLIAASGIGPTLASRAFALLNAGFFDLWAHTDAAATPHYTAAAPPQGSLLSAVSLEQALHQFAARLLQQWFPDAEAELRLQDELHAAAQGAVNQPLTTAAWQSLLDHQLAAMPPLDPWSEAPAPLDHAGSIDANRAIDRWLAEHIPIDDLTGPREQFLTPEWGTLPAFSTDDVTLWRPEGPERFFVDGADEIAVLELSSTSLELMARWQDHAGVWHEPGVYDVRDPLQQQWMLQGLINPGFIAQAQQLVDLQATLSDEQKLIAEFWESGAGTAFPPGNWIVFTSLMAEREQLSLSEQIKLFSSVGHAVGDAGIAAWDSKVHFDYARPVRVIRDLAALDLLDGEDLEQWNSYQVPGSNSSPPFAEYVSGHSSFSAAAAAVLEGYLGHADFDVVLPTFVEGSSRFQPGETPAEPTTLAWASFADAAHSAGLSRLYGGIHFADGNDHGLQVGQAVGRDVLHAAQELAYAELDVVLDEPYGLRNGLELTTRGVVLDDVSLPQTIQRLGLGSGDDWIEMSSTLTAGPAIDAGPGHDVLRYGIDSGPVQVDLQRGQASGLQELWGVEEVHGAAAADVITGSVGSDWLQGNGADDLISGGAGWDTASYRGERRDYRFEGNRVLDQRDASSAGFDGTDQLAGIEALRFSDGIWPVTALFEPRHSSVQLQQPQQPMHLSEGEVLTLRLERDGDLSEPLELELGWQQRWPDQLSWDDFGHEGSAADTWSVIWPAGEDSLVVDLTSAHDGLNEGPEQGHLQLHNIRVQSDGEQLMPLQLNWSSQPVSISLLDGDPSGAVLGVQHISSSPLPLWFQPGAELQVPLSYSATDAAQNLSGLAFELTSLPAGLELVGFELHPLARAHVDLSLVEPHRENGLRFSLVSDQALPSSSSGGLSFPIGTLTLASQAELNPADLITGIGFEPLSKASGYGMEIKGPDLQAVDWSLDVDGDGQVGLYTDGLMVLRHLLGVRGDGVMGSALPSGSATRQSGADVSNWISQGVERGLLDLDGDGSTRLYSDGLMLLRSMMGVMGSRLIESIGAGSPLLEGQALGTLSAQEKSWVAEQLEARIDAIS